MAQRKITMYRDGRMTVPMAARKALHLEGEADFTYEIVEDGLFLHPVVSIPREDAWAYTPEHRAAIERARNSPSYGGVTSEDLEELADAPDPAATLEHLKERWTRYEP